jgi:hypothetical protein
MNRSYFKTPSKAEYLRCMPLQNAHIRLVCCAFSSACALLSGLIRGLETASIKNYPDSKKQNNLITSAIHLFKKPSERIIHDGI